MEVGDCYSQIRDRMLYAVLIMEAPQQILYNGPLTKTNPFKFIYKHLAAAGENTESMR